MMTWRRFCAVVSPHDLPNGEENNLWSMSMEVVSIRGMSLVDYGEISIRYLPSGRHDIFGLDLLMLVCHFYSIY